MLSSTTFQTRQHHTDGVALTGTYSEAPTAWDDPTDLSSLDSYQGCVPFVKGNQSDQDIRIADDATFDADAAFSMGIWVTIPNGYNSQMILQHGVANSEFTTWKLSWNNDIADSFHFGLGDNTTPASNQSYTRSTALSPDTKSWTFLVCTWSGTDGYSNMHLYVDGVLDDNTGADVGTGVTVPYLSTVDVAIMSRTLNADDDRYFEGKVAGGPLSPFFAANKALNAQEVYRLYLLGRAAMGLQ